MTVGAIKWFLKQRKRKRMLRDRRKETKTGSKGSEKNTQDHCKIIGVHCNYFVDPLLSISIPDFIIFNYKE
jgi:hypothetical protein